MTLIARCCSRCKNNSWRPSKKSQLTGQWLFLGHSQPEEYHKGGYRVVARLYPSPILHVRTYSRTVSKWLTSCVPRECWYTGTIWDIFQVQGQGFSLLKQRRKVLVEAAHNTDPGEKKPTRKKIRLHAWTFRSHSRTIKSNQEKGESWDFRSQRLNFLVIHRQKLNLEKFDSEVSIARKKNNRKYLTMCICLYTNRKRYKQTLMSVVDFNYLCTVIENGFLLI